MRRALQLMIIVGLLAMLATPASALADMCSGMIGPSFTNETASGPVVVVPGKSIGPISVGMTRRQITRVAQPQGRGYMGFRFRARGVHIYVGYGHWGRARRLFAASSKLVVEGVSLSDGPDRLGQSLPALYLERCEGTLGGPTEGALRGAPWMGITEFGWYPAPELPRILMINTAMRR